MPTAIYSSGATTLPVCPTCRELSAYPESTAALDAPIAAPNASASGVSTESKFSLFLTPLPPDTIRLAVPNSGRSLFVSDSESHSEALAVELETDASSSEADPDVSAGEKEAVRTVKTLMGSIDLTVASALPA